MPPIRPVARRRTRTALVRVAGRRFGAAVLSLSCVVAFAQDVLPPGALRDRYPVGSIDSAERADAALAATSGAKARVEKAFAADARACVSRVLVNACIDAARDLQRKRLADIDAVELEANRWKRRDRADRLEAGRAKREGERAENQPADAEARARNRKAFDERQAQATRDAAAARTKADRASAAPGRKHSPTIRTPAAPPTAAALEQRAKNAAEHATKVAEAEAHRHDIDRRVAQKAADRKRRDDEKAAKDARAAAAAAAAAAAGR